MKFIIAVLLCLAAFFQLPDQANAQPTCEISGWKCNRRTNRQGFGSNLPFEPSYIPTGMPSVRCPRSTHNHPIPAEQTEPRYHLLGASSVFQQFVRHALKQQLPNLCQHRHIWPAAFPNRRHRSIDHLRIGFAMRQSCKTLGEQRFCCWMQRHGCCLSLFDRQRHQQNTNWDLLRSWRSMLKLNSGFL